MDLQAYSADPVPVPCGGEAVLSILYPLCQRLQIPMDQFMDESVAQAVARAEEGLEKEAELTPTVAAG